jgi:hypothetical protein
MIKILGALIVVISSTISQNTTPLTLKPIISPKDKFGVKIFSAFFTLLKIIRNTCTSLHTYTIGFSKQNEKSFTD